MSFSSWLRSWKSTLARSSSGNRRRHKHCPPRPPRLSVERLEARTMLTAGALDPSFGIGGKALTDIKAAAHDDLVDGSRSIAVQADGKLLVVGSTTQENT